LAHWVFDEPVCGTAASAHGPGEDETSVELGKGKVTIHYGTPKLADRNLDEMTKPGLAWFMGMNNPTTLETTVALTSTARGFRRKVRDFLRPDEQRNWTLLCVVAVERPLSRRPSCSKRRCGLRRRARLRTCSDHLEKAGDGASLMVAWGT